MVNSAGEALFKTKGTLPADHPQNYFFYQFFKGMSFDGNPDITDIDSLKSAVNSGQTGAVYVTDDSYSYAISFKPLEIDDWHLMLMVERSAISGGRLEYMQQVQWIAVGVNLLIIVVCVVFYLVNAI